MKRLLLAAVLYLSLPIWVSCGSALNAQTNLPDRQAGLDSLWAVWQDESQADTTRLNTMEKFIRQGYMKKKPDSTYYYAQLQYDFAKSKGLRKYIADALNLQGNSYYNRRDYPKALEYYQQSLKIREEIENKKGIAASLYNIAYAYFYLTDYPKALDYFKQTLIISEEVENKIFMADALKRMGYIYAQQGNKSKAVDAYERALRINEEISDSTGIANILVSIGMFYSSQGDYSKALEYVQKSLTISEEIGYKSGIASSLGNLGMLFELQGDFAKALDFYRRTLKLDEELAWTRGVVITLGNIGGVYAQQGDYPTALNYFQRGLKICEENEYRVLMASALAKIGFVYQGMKDYSKALDYSLQVLKIREAFSDKKGIAAASINIGNLYTEQGDYTKALDYYEQGLIICEENGYKDFMAYALNSIGDFYKIQSDYPKALDNYHRSLIISEEISYKKRIGESYYGIGTVVGKQGNYQESAKWCEKGLQIAQELSHLSNQELNCECLYEAYKAMGNGNKALVYHEKMLALQDSLNLEETSKKLQQMEFAKQVLQDSIATAEKEHLVQLAHEEEIREEEKTRNISFLIGGLILLLAIGLYSRLHYVRKSKAVIEKEKDRSENLLLNILPYEIAQELKEKGRADARNFELVSILFTDFIDFTATSVKLSAGDLVDEINHCFEAFDHILEKYNIEKIKTIGDSYMAAGGLPIPTDDSVKNTVLGALEMQAFITNRKLVKQEKGEEAFEMRLGIHTGPVVAGIVGVKKFQYDVWGDTVNTASRVENHCKPGKVNISQVTYEFIKDDPQFTFESRGKIQAKGKGEIEMWFVSFR